MSSIMSIFTYNLSVLCSTYFNVLCFYFIRFDSRYVWFDALTNYATGVGAITGKGNLTHQWPCTIDLLINGVSDYLLEFSDWGNGTGVKARM